MKTIRHCVFETNSSSTHSITISKYRAPKEINIPRNYNGTFIVEEYGDCGGSDESYRCDKHQTEINKLRFLINIIASIYDNGEFDDEIEEWNYDKKDIKEYTSEYYKNFVNARLFKWLKEAIKEVTETEIEIKQPENNWFPFFERTYDENEGINHLLGNITNEKEFKDTIKKIIFDKDIIIENKNVPYGIVE